MDAPLNPFGFLLKIALCVGAEASGCGGPNFGLDGPAGLPMIAPRTHQGVPAPKREVKYQLMGQPGVGQGLHRVEDARPRAGAGRFTDGSRPGRAAGLQGTAT